MVVDLIAASGVRTDFAPFGARVGKQACKEPNDSTWKPRWFVSLEREEGFALSQLEFVRWAERQHLEVDSVGGRIPAGSRPPSMTCTHSEGSTATAEGIGETDEYSICLPSN